MLPPVSQSQTQSVTEVSDCDSRPAAGATHASAAASARVLLELHSERELAMLAAVQLADWLQQAEAVNASGFGGSDATKSAYTRGGVPGHWRWAEGGMHGFRKEAYEAMLGLLEQDFRPCCAQLVLANKGRWAVAVGRWLV